MLRDGVGHARAAGGGKGPAVCRRAVQNVSGGAPAGFFGLRRDKIDQIVDMDNVSAGKHAGKRGLHVLKHAGAVGAAVHFDARAARQLVFGDETD